MLPTPRPHPYALALICTLSLMLGQAALAQAAPSTCDPTQQSCQTGGSGSSYGLGGGSSSSSGGCDPTKACCPGSGGGTNSCSSAGPASTGLGTPANIGVGNPINIASGNKYQREEDMPALPGVLGLELVRHYNSQYALPNVPNGILGHGWKLSYETQLYDTARGVQIVQADGTRLIFDHDKDDPSHCASHNLALGQVRISQHARLGKQYTWRWRNGRELLFNAQGLLVQISAPSGEFVSLDYDPKGWLIKVTDPQGRQLRLNYLDSKTVQSDPRGVRHFRGVQSVDTPLGRYTYGYGSPLPKGASDQDQVLVQANLSQVGIPTWADPQGRRHELSNDMPSRSSITRLYHYEDPRHPTLLTGISVQGTGSDGQSLNQRLVSWGYDPAARAVLSVKGDGQEKVTLDNHEWGRTVLTNSLGQTTTYEYTTLGGQWRLLQVRGAGCASCGVVNVRYVYDAQGNLTEQIDLDGQGHPVQGLRTVLDRWGRPVRVQRVSYRAGKAGAAQWLKRFEYASADTDEPTLVATPSVVGRGEHQVQVRYNRWGQPTQVTETGYSPINEQGQPQATPLARTTHYAYTQINGRSVLTEIVGPLGKGPKGTPEDSDMTLIQWDERGDHVVNLIHTGGDGVNLRYEPATGLVAEIKDRRGAYAQYTYNHRLQVTTVRVSSPGWAHPTLQTWRYDALGNATEQGTLQTNGDPESFIANAKQGFDALGRLQWHADRLGVLVKNTYDSESRLIASGQYSNAMAKVSHFQPQTVGLHRIHSNAKSDDFGRVVAIDSPDSGTTTRTYNNADQLVASTDANGNRASYEYDIKGRITLQIVVAAETKNSTRTTWTYSGTRLVSVSHPNQDEAYEYDDRGLLVAKVVTLKTAVGQLVSVFRYEYDEDGVLQRASLPDGSYLAYNRNGQGQIVAIQRELIQTHWLRWAAPAQTIVQDLKRDIVGLKHYVTGSRIDVRQERSRDGVLARVVYRKLDPNLHDASQALLDHSYLWDVRGNLLGVQSLINQNPQFQSYAYDKRGRLIASAQGGLGSPLGSRYLYDAAGRRVLSQDGIKDQTDIASATQRVSYESGTHRWTKFGPDSAQYDNNGQPSRIADKEYSWDALGQLIQVRQGGETLATYAYNHRGERISKSVAGTATEFIYDGNQLIAELNTQGRLTHQYLYLADQVVAVVDTPEGQAMSPSTQTVTRSVLHDLGVILGQWGVAQPIVWLHTNHLGAPELATDVTGHVVWQANYAPFGHADIKSQGFTLQLRLPGQYEDSETGLHYNRRRYYDPARGQYLSADPAGNPDGPNGYSYVRFNPLRYVDPDGLILFAFDGTGNTKDTQWLDEHHSSLSDVVLFKNLYASDNYLTNIKSNNMYMSGVGTVQRDTVYGDITPPVFDMGLNRSGVARINRMLQYFNDEASDYVDSDTMNVDIIGFSRGAAEARDFSNQIVAHSIKDAAGNYWYGYKNSSGINQCQKVNFRFMGLWDTVLSTNVGRDYNLAIPNQFAYVAQAVALNEYRGDVTHPFFSVGAFPLESIMQGPYSPVPVPGKSRIEMGFIGAHADIGGGFASGENDIPKVTLAWMVQQARAAGVSMNDPPTNIPANTVIHDKSDSILTGAPTAGAEDRTVKYRNGSTTTQRQMAFSSGMSYADTQQFITYLPDAQRNASFVTGTVDMPSYLSWLRGHGYDLGNLAVN